MIVALAVLAIADLVVGVSNDAVNFLNSAIGSKAVSFKTIMIVASDNHNSFKGNCFRTDCRI